MSSQPIPQNESSDLVQEHSVTESMIREVPKMRTPKDIIRKWTAPTSGLLENLDSPASVADIFCSTTSYGWARPADMYYVPGSSEVPRNFFSDEAAAAAATDQLFGQSEHDLTCQSPASSTEGGDTPVYVNQGPSLFNMSDTEQPMVTRSNRIEATTVLVTPGYGTGKSLEVRYFDAKVIGNGSFGTVFMATLYDTKETVAIKRVKQDKRYKNRELTIMRKLEHPNIVRLMYYFYTNEGSEDFLNLILEFMPKTLQQINKMGSPIPEFNVKLYMFQLLRGLSYMHYFKICHRDIKPHNLLVDPDYGILKICDFGSAKELHENDVNVSYICSRYYRAPELVYGAEKYTTAVDMWSFGTVLLEMYTHTPIFRGSSPADQITAIMKILGTPTKEELISMNPTFKDKEYVKPKSGTGFVKIFTETPSKLAVDLASQILTYDPRQRLTAIECLADPYFCQLKQPNLEYLPNGNLMPRIFDWYEKEYNIRSDLNSQIFPKAPEVPTASYEDGNGEAEEREMTLSPEPNL